MNGLLDPNNLPPVLNARQIAEYLGVSMSFVYRIMRQNEFPRLDIGARCIVATPAFLKWIASREQRKQ